jgi:hypothetical protein
MMRRVLRSGRRAATMCLFGAKTKAEEQAMGLAVRWLLASDEADWAYMAQALLARCPRPEQRAAVRGALEGVALRMTQGVGA